LAFPRTIGQTASVIPRLRLLASLLLALLVLGGCDRAREALRPSGDAPADPRWQADSTLVAGAPDVLYRVVPGPDGPRATPIFMIGAGGLKLLRLSNRGWRFFDLTAMSGGDTLYALRFGRTAGPAEVVRGMWERVPALDSVPGCPAVMPSALMRLSVKDGVRFLTTRPQPPLKHARLLQPGAVEAAIEGVPTLVAPPLGVSPSALARYRRAIHQVPSGAGADPTIVLVYDDPEVVADSANPIGERPRHLVIVMDKGIYGYKQSYTYSTLGNAKAPPRLEFLDYLDTDGDGMAELVFGVQRREFPHVLIVLRHEGGVWREVLRNVRERCDVLR
jgi:hypothetical protein